MITTKTRKVKLNKPLLQRRRTNTDKTYPASVVWWRRGKTWRLPRNEWAKRQKHNKRVCENMNKFWIKSISRAVSEAWSIHEAFDRIMISRGCAVTAVLADHVRACCWHPWLRWSVEECFQTLWQQNSKEESRKADAWHNNVTRA